MGRPKLPKGEAKGRIVPVRFKHDDLKEIAAKAKAADQTVSDWVRGTVHKEIKRVGDPVSRCHAGEILREEFLKPLKMKVSHLAEKSGIPEPILKEIVAEKESITPEIAASLAQVFHVSAQFWMNLQNAYDKK